MFINKKQVNKFTTLLGLLNDKQQTKMKNKEKENFYKNLLFKN